MIHSIREIQETEEFRVERYVSLVPRITRSVFISHTLPYTLSYGFTFGTKPDWIMFIRLRGPEEPQTFDGRGKLYRGGVPMMHRSEMPGWFLTGSTTSCMYFVHKSANRHCLVRFSKFCIFPSLCAYKMTKTSRPITFASFVRILPINQFPSSH